MSCKPGIYHSLLCRTLRLIIDDGFLMTIQSIIDVAKDKENLAASRLDQCRGLHRDDRRLTM